MKDQELDTYVSNKQKQQLLENYRLIETEVDKGCSTFEKNESNVLKQIEFMEEKD